MMPEMNPRIAETHDCSPPMRLTGPGSIAPRSESEPPGLRGPADAAFLLDDNPSRLRQPFNRLSLALKYYEILTVTEGFTAPEAHEQNIQQAVRHASAVIWDILRKTAKSSEELDDERLTLLLVALMKMSSRLTFEHSQRVMNWSTALAAKLNLDRDMVVQVRQGALFRDIGKTGLRLLGSDDDDRRSIAELLDHDCRILHEGGGFHDIGKLCIPAEILDKLAALDADELSVMRQHPLIGEAILKPIRSLEKILPAVRNHHEKWDGSGYPDGMAGRAIPVIARIICITDSFDAMTSDRPYRKALSHERAVEELRKNAGRQFDPVLVDLFLEILQKGRS